jgi:hypothetical protein
MLLNDFGRVRRARCRFGTACCLSALPFLRCAEYLSITGMTLARVESLKGTG